MRTPRTSTAPGAPKLDDLTAAVRQAAEGEEVDPFDEAMMAAVGVAAEALKTEGAELEAIRGRMVRLARQVSR